MEKRISYSQFQQVKSAAKMIDPLQKKMASLMVKMRKVAEEYKENETQVKALEEGIVKILGFHVSDLVKKVIESGTDGKGNPIKTTKYLPTDIVSYDSNKKQYVIQIPDPEETQEAIVPPTTEELPGSDFDADAERVSQELASGPEAEELFK
jgi:hypothetical protein